jgi:tetratricopeptide (TPR) repeat protein
VARKRRFREGLRALERARELSPEDAGVYYNLGWCYEFAAHHLSRRPGGKGLLGMEPDRLYAKAVEYMRRCLELNPDEEMRGAIAKLLERTPGGDA